MVNVQNRRLQAEVEFKSAFDQYTTGNNELAIKHAQRTLEINPYYHTAYFLLGYSYLGVNHLVEAERALLNMINSPAMEVIFRFMGDLPFEIVVGQLELSGCVSKTASSRLGAWVNGR